MAVPETGPWKSLDYSMSVQQLIKEVQMKSCRRGFIKRSTLGLVSVAFLPIAAYAAEELSEADPSAVALGYRADATKVDKVKFPKYAAGQECANCQFYQGNASAKTAACPLFSGKTVEGAGWCNGYVKKA